MWKWFFVVFAVFSTLLLIVYLVNHDSANSSPSLPKSHKFPPRKDVSKVNDEIRKVPVQCPAQSYTFVKKENEELNRQIIDKGTDEIYVQPEKVIYDARSNPILNIALFNVVASCYKFDEAVETLSSECPDIKSKLKLRRHPIELLEVAAKAGVREAQLMYVLNAPLIASQFRARNDSNALAYADYLLRQAEIFGKSAAESHDHRTLRIMRSAYIQGNFGRVDYEKAYYFALPLESSGSEEDKKILASIGAKLNPLVREKVKSIALGCRPDNESAILVSPFE